MERECYEIKVLHHLNPHLIWVEVISPAEKSDDFYFEQIGLYGILPLETELDVVEECMKTRKGHEWAPGIVIVMSQILKEAQGVWFSPTYIDRRTSIFDDNIHKYGEIAIRTKNGTLKKLSHILTKTSFAYKDECAFHTDLTNFKLKTKLDANTTINVIAALEKACTRKTSPKNLEKYLKKKTSVFQAAKVLESALTETNINRHNKHLQDIDVDDVMNKKMQDFHLCKDDDGSSVGRGVTKTKHIVKTSEQKSTFMKRLELMRKAKERKSELNSDNTDGTNDTKLDTFQSIKNTAQILEETKNMLLKHAVVKRNESTPITDKNDIEDTPVNPPEVRQEREESPGLDGLDYIYQKPLKSDPTAKPYIKRRIPKYDQEKEVLIAYGPAGIKCSALPVKVVPKQDIHANLNKTEDVKPNEEADEELTEPTEDNMLTGLDSEVNVPIENKLTLFKKLRQNMKAVEETAQQKVGDSSLSTNSILSTDSDSVKEAKSSGNRSFLLKRLDKFRSLCSNNVSHTDTSNKDSSDSSIDRNSCKSNSDDEAEYLDIVKKLNLNENTLTPKKVVEAPKIFSVEPNNVNPFKNIDSNISKFVEKLVSPVLMVHSKENKRIEPIQQLRDVNFTPLIVSRLTNMGVKQPMTLQTVSWFSILRGYSLFMISPKDSGKTLGYVPAVCRLVSDFDTSDKSNGTGPIAIILCATSIAVASVERMCRLFLEGNKTALSYYAGVDDLKITTSLLNGVDILVSTAPGLVKLLNITDFGVDLRRLNTFVLDDCERLLDVYPNEVKFALMKIKLMYKSRINTVQKVQFVVASRVWCDFMEPMVLKAPKSVVSIGSFQECVLYSKSNMTVSFVSSANKVDNVLDFMSSVDATKRTVIVCRTTDEVRLIDEALANHKYVKFTADTTMTVESLHALSSNWADYGEQAMGAVLICCDDNLTHLNVTNAHHLLHYSLPALYSMFAKRFAVLVDHYPSIFKNTDTSGVKIKVLLESENVEQLPKILNFVKRCVKEIPESLNEVCQSILKEKDLRKAKCHVPICDSTLALGECPDYWNCDQRHSILKDFDEPKDFVPKSGTVSFKVLHYHTAVSYSAKLISNNVNGKLKKYPQTYNSLRLKMGMYYSKEINKKLHGTPKVGDICAAAITDNNFERCQVIRILKRYVNNGLPNIVRVKLIDEEIYETTRDILLYHLPDDLKQMESHVVQVRLVGVQPMDKDVTFSELALRHLEKLTADDNELYLRGRVVTAVNNVVLVDELEACQDLSSSGETVVRYNFKQELLDTHAILNPDHVSKLEKLCSEIEFRKPEKVVIESEQKKVEKVLPKPRWAHLPTDDVHLVYFASAEDPDKFFIRLEKFEDCLISLSKDIQKYITNETPKPVTSVKIHDIVLAKFPDDSAYYRARIDSIPGETKTKCFFVDHGDWRYVPLTDVVPITAKFINVMPFQAIECKLVGLKPVSDNWSEFSTNWFCDQCYVNEKDNLLKELYVKTFTKEKAECTGGYKYGVALIDTTTEVDVIINSIMLESNMAQEDVDEIQYLKDMDFTRKETKTESDSENDNTDKEDWDKEAEVNKIPEYIRTFDNKTKTDQPQFLRSLPLVSSGSEDSLDKYDVEFSKDDLMKIFKFGSQSIQRTPHLPAIAGGNVKETHFDNNSPVNKDCISVNSIGSSVTSDFEVLPSLSGTIQELDSDDLTSPDATIVKDTTPKKVDFEPLSTLRKPKLVWRQNKTSVSLRIELIGVEKYTMSIKEKNIEFKTTVHDTDYAFDFELYGVIDPKASTHSNKGLYIYARMTKLLKKNWLSLTKDGGIKKWIVYDHDSIDVSSDEEDHVAIEKERLKKIVEQTHNDSDSGDDDDYVLDDINFGSKYL